MANKGRIEHGNFICIAELCSSFSRQVYNEQGLPEWVDPSFYLMASVFDKYTFAPVNIPKIALIMGVGKDYYPGWDLWNDKRMYKENCANFSIGPWKYFNIDQKQIGGDAYFIFPDGSTNNIRHLRADKMNVINIPAIQFWPPPNWRDLF